MTFQDRRANKRNDAIGGGMYSGNLGPRPAHAYGGPAGDSASTDALKHLRGEVSALKAARAALPHLKRAMAAIARKDFAAAQAAAQAAADRDPRLIQAWHMLAIAREHQDDWPGALEAYERGLALDPENPAIANDLGRLAAKLGMYPQAEALFRHYLAARPFAPEASNNLAAILRDKMRYDEAISLLQTAIGLDASKAILWNTLGTVLEEMGDLQQALIFYTEALRLQPSEAKARYNLSNVLFALGRRPEAIAACREAMAGAASAEDRTTMRFALATMLLAEGEIAAGWEAYTARLEPTYYQPLQFLAPRPRWEPGVEIEGRHLLLIGEQGLGDEIMFANVIDDVLTALGPDGRLTLAVTDRLVTLFQRSFPRARVGPHVSTLVGGRATRGAPFVGDWADIDLWTPMGEAVRQLRPDLKAFPRRPNGFMRTDPQRVAHWREVLGQLPGQRVGLLWTSMLINSTRHRHFAPFEAWEPVLRTPGTSFVNLQYGDCSAAIAKARADYGVEIFEPPGIDLKNDLDDVAALASALDLVIGFSNASFNLGAAAGAPSWLLTSAETWARLGSDHYPWYSQVRAFWPKSAMDWPDLMGQVADALGRTQHVDKRQAVGAGQ